MDPITVSKADLVATLRENRDVHRQMFLDAQDRYRTAMIAELDRALDEARTGGVIRRAFSLPVPEDHTDEFDRVLDMLAWDKRDDVELSEDDFRQYVQNEWGWARSFAANTGSYLA